ncbi:hypothetical protein [Limosilactobacillus reuteri]|uniref:hypothetical protein n=1 Tax=Limosilactobacillus reuteri TaxID=1598 RepID=UPI0011469F89|nr:hypothetical protein [Limosilactobacillus reuteri]MCH5378864.1 hypothetical protein [Limosilactobacillus reuteri]
MGWWVGIKCVTGGKHKGKRKKEKKGTATLPRAKKKKISITNTHTKDTLNKQKEYITQKSGGKKKRKKN